MRKIVLSLPLLCPLCALAGGSVDLNGLQFSVDTVCHYYIGPGTTHTQLELNADGRRVDAFVVTLDKDDPSYRPYVKPRVELGHDTPHRTEEISNTAIRKSGGDRQYIAGINADFFQMVDVNLNYWGWPVNSTVIDGKVATCRDHNAYLQSFIIGTDGQMWIDHCGGFNYIISAPDGDGSASTDRLNIANRSQGQLVIYNDFHEGRLTDTKTGERDLILTIADGEKWAVNKAVNFTVTGEWHEGASTIPENGMVLTAMPGYSNDWLFGLHDGDKVSLLVDKPLEKNDNIRPEILHMVSGDVHVLNDGRTEFAPPAWWYGSNDHIYPISLAGYSKDQHKIVYVTVARKTSINSMGVNYPESADLMRFLGCSDAVNFDGGGSATMYAAPMGVVSFILYDTERPVGNGLFLAMDTPVDNEIAAIRFRDHTKTINRYGFYKPVVLGYNQYDQLIELDVQDYVVEPSDNYEVRDGGIIADAAGSYDVTISRNGHKASLTVNVADADIKPAYAVVVADRTHKALPAVRSVAGSICQDVPVDAFAWTSADPAVAEIDPSTGYITAVANGTTTVRGTRGETNVDVCVSVEISDTEYRHIDDNFGDNTWTVTPEGIDSDYSVVSTGEGWMMEFNNNRKRSLKLTFAKDVTVYGLPSAVVFETETNGSVISAVTLGYSAANGKGDFAADMPFESTGIYKAQLSEDFDITDASFYPLKVKYITIEPLAQTDTNHFKFDIRRLGFLYDDYEASVGNVAADGRYTRLPLYVYGNTVATVADAEYIGIYTIDGKLAARSAGCSVTAPGGGTYIVRAAVGGYVMSSKIIL